MPEGLPVRDNTVMVVVECTDRNLAWLPGHLETSIQRGVWFPSTITTGDLVFKRKLKVWYEHTGADMGLLPFALHDFGARGYLLERVLKSVVWHLVNFMGSDTVEGVVAANKYYHSDMAGFSVRATEHSIECAYGGSSEQEAEYLETVLKNGLNLDKLYLSLLMGMTYIVLHRRYALSSMVLLLVVGQR